MFHEQCVTVYILGKIIKRIHTNELLHTRNKQNKCTWNKGKINSRICITYEDIMEPLGPGLQPYRI